MEKKPKKGNSFLIALYCLTFPTRKIIPLWNHGSVPSPLQTWFQTNLELCHEEPLAYYTGRMPDKLAEVWLGFMDFLLKVMLYIMWLDLTGMLSLILFYWSLIVSLFHCHLSIWITLVYHWWEIIFSLALSLYATALWTLFTSLKERKRERKKLFKNQIIF